MKIIHEDIFKGLEAATEENPAFLFHTCDSKGKLPSYLEEGFQKLFPATYFEILSTHLSTEYDPKIAARKGYPIIRAEQLRVATFTVTDEAPEGESHAGIGLSPWIKRGLNEALMCCAKIDAPLHIPLLCEDTEPRKLMVSEDIINLCMEYPEVDTYLYLRGPIL